MLDSFGSLAQSQLMRVCRLALRNDLTGVCLGVIVNEMKLSLYYRGDWLSRGLVEAYVYDMQNKRMNGGWTILTYIHGNFLNCAWNDPVVAECFLCLCSTHYGRRKIRLSPSSNFCDALLALMVCRALPVKYDSNGLLYINLFFVLVMRTYLAIS